MSGKTWSVYILRCADGTLYTGATNDVRRRLAAHRAGTGAKYTRGRSPLRLIWSKRLRDRGSALKLEARIKALPRRLKLEMVRVSGRPKAPR